MQRLEAREKGIGDEVQGLSGSIHVLRIGEGASFNIKNSSGSTRTFETGTRQAVNQ